MTDSREPMRSERLTPILVEGSFTDIHGVLDVAAQIAKRIFKTNQNIVIRDSYHTEYGWIVLVVKPEGCSGKAPGRLGVGK